MSQLVKTWFIRSFQSYQLLSVKWLHSGSLLTAVYSFVRIRAMVGWPEDCWLEDYWLEDYSQLVGSLVHDEEAYLSGEGLTFLGVLKDSSKYLVLSPRTVV